MANAKSWLAYTNPLLWIVAIPIGIGVVLASTIDAIASSKISENTCKAFNGIKEDLE